MSARKCREHGSTLGRQSVKRVVVDRDLPYPRPDRGETEGEASEIECPWCGLCEDVTDGSGLIEIVECGHCGKRFEITSVTVIVKTRKVIP